jgi:hypothetical protein
MKQYAIIDKLHDGDWFEDLFDTEEEAVKYAEDEWSTFDSEEKLVRTDYYVAEVEVDEYGAVEHENRVIKTFKAWR